tara:strand:+ start:110 stop:370 length:261 start_codon:yes stop_codon:yes gene_type:complete
MQANTVTDTDTDNLTQQNANTDVKEKNEVRLVDVQVTNENESLRCLVAFLNLAQRRGAFTIDESSKIWECIQIFQSSGANKDTVSV